MPTVVRYRDRESHEIVEETIFSEGALRWFYEDPVGSKIFAAALNRTWLSWLYGRLQDLPSSRKQIPEFVRTHRLVIDEFAEPPESFKSFNAFFCRRLKPEARPFPREPDVFPSPADGKILVYPTLPEEARLPIKGTSISIAELLKSESEARPHLGGSAFVLRLAPYDYHRFHFPDSGLPKKARLIPGRYHSVSPIALSKVPNAFCRNKRMVTTFHSEQFGELCLIEVGALTVGTIIQTYRPDLPVKRGDEKGFFRFGGSTIVVLFQPGQVTFDPDLIADSVSGLEVQVRAGSRIACRNRVPDA